MNRLDPTIPIEHAKSPFALAIDIGSSSTRAMLFDGSGRPIGGFRSYRTHEFHTPSAGAAELAPEQLLEEVFDCVDEVYHSAGSAAKDIGVVGVSTLVTNILGINDDDQSITPLFTYADTRAQESVRQLRELVDEEELIRRTGCRLHTSYLPALFHWLAKVQPGLFGQVRRWMSIGEYLFQRLFGMTRATYSVASWTGLFNRMELAWDGDLFELLPLRQDQFSELTDTDRPIQGLSEKFGTRWPDLRNVPWTPAIADGAAANIGMLCLNEERLAVTMGTSSAMRLTTEEPLPEIPAGLWSYNVDGVRSLVGGALSEGGNIYQWLAEVLRLETTAQLETELKQYKPDSHNLTILPFLAGERSPGWAGRARAVFAGLSWNTSALDLLRAGLESVALRLGLVYQQFGTYSNGVNQVIAGGGALRRSVVMPQILSDVLGQPISLSAIEETSSRGAALVALRSIGALPSFEDAPDLLGPTFEPSLDHHHIYQSAMDRQRRLYQAFLDSPERDPTSNSSP